MYFLISANCLVQLLLHALKESQSVYGETIIPIPKKDLNEFLLLLLSPGVNEFDFTMFYEGGDEDLIFNHLKRNCQGLKKLRKICGFPRWKRPIPILELKNTLCRLTHLLLEDYSCDDETMELISINYPYLR
jgi:hypothetical protein